MRDNSVYIEIILDRAKKDVKGNQGIYNYYKRQLEDLNLPPHKYENAIKELIKILRV